MKLENLIKLLGLSQPFILKDDDEQEKKDQCIPYNLGVVLDRSGSMEGSPLTNCKKAIENVIDNLRENDILHFVTYDDDSEVIFQNGKYEMKQHLKNLVSSIESKGCTNIMAGVNEMRKILQESEQTPKRIFVFSDGLVNTGISDKGKICTSIKDIHDVDGVNFTSFGIGSDFDEPLMKSLAEYGKGDYFFIDGPEDIKGKIEKGMDVLTSLLGKNAKLFIKGVNGGKIVNIFQFDEDLSKGIHLGDMCEDDIRNIVLEMEVTPQKKEEILTFEYVFEEMKTEKKISMSGSLKVKITDDNKLLEQKHDEVEVAVAIARSGEDDLRILKFLDEEKFDQAIELKERAIKGLENVKEKDSTGLIDVILKSAKNGLEKIKNKKDVKTSKKTVSYSSYNCSYRAHSRSYV